MRTTKYRSAILLAGLVAGLSTHAATITWDGGGDGVNWSDGTNWTGTPDNTAPTSTDDAVFPDAPSGLNTSVDATFAGAVHTWRSNQSTTTQTMAFDLGRGLTIGAGDVTTTHFQYGSTVSDAAMIAWDLNGNALSLAGPDAAQTFKLYGTFTLDAAGSTIKSTTQHGTAVGNRPIFLLGSGANLAVINVTANAVIGNVTTGTTTSRNPWLCEINIGAVSEVNVSNNATLDFQRRQRVDGTYKTLQVNNSGTMRVSAGSTLGIKFTQVNNDSKLVGITLANAGGGVVNQNGTVALTMADRGTANISNVGTWSVGTAAVITGELVGQGSGDTGVVSFGNQAGGVMTGAGATASLDYNPLDTATYLNQVLTLTNSAVIAPGAGTGGAETASVGTLTMTDVNVVCDATGTLALDIGGTSSGTFDKLVLAAGASPAGTLTLDANATLDLTYVNGFAPAQGYKIEILGYGAVSGAFDLANRLVIHGATGPAADVSLYTITYGPTGATLAFAPRGTVVLVR